MLDRLISFNIHVAISAMSKMACVSALDLPNLCGKWVCLWVRILGERGWESLFKYFGMSLDTALGQLFIFTSNLVFIVAITPE